MNTSARSAVSSRLPAVPSNAATLFAPQPCASGIVVSAIASAPTLATARGGLPSRIAGTTNSSTSATLITRLASESTPRQRAKTSTIRTKTPARINIGLRRSKS